MALGNPAHPLSLPARSWEPATPNEIEGLVHAPSGDPEFEQILVGFKRRIDPDKGDEQPSTEEGDREENHPVNPQAPAKVPERTEEESPPVPLEPGGKGLMVQADERVLRARDPDGRIQDLPDSPSDRLPQTPKTVHDERSQRGLLLFLSGFLILRMRFPTRPFLGRKLPRVEFYRLVHPQTDRTSAFEQAVLAPLDLFP